MKMIYAIVNNDDSSAVQNALTTEGFVVTKPVSYTHLTLLLPQGMVSTASIEYRHEAEVLARSDDPELTYVQQVLPDKMRYNLEYVRDYSVGSYFKTLYKTVSCVFKRDEKINGAN